MEIGYRDQKEFMGIEDKVVKQKIREIAEEYSSDVLVNIDKYSTLEQIVAIENTIKGTERANNDLHKIVEYFMNILDMSNHDLMVIWEDIIDKEGGE